MKLVNLKCPNCQANVEVNGDFEEAVCNYCGTKFLVEDENATEEERIIKAVSKKEKKDRDYYASNDYKKKLLSEKSGKLSALINDIGEQFDKRRKYINSDEYKAKQEEEWKTAKIVFAIFGGIGILIIIISIISYNISTHIVECNLNNQDYIVSYKKGQNIKCSVCTEKMVKELNKKYLDKDNISLTRKNIKSYFKNNGGSCKKNEDD